ncbi:MAG TPA: MFS transporter [Cellvibrio sp.]|nr:MFS transporter [Cellvibrio sp.]
MKSPARYGPAYAAVTTLFLAWGFITSLIDPLVAAVKGIFSLTDVQAQLSAFAFFIAYGVMSFPAAAILSRFKSVPTILMALGTMIGGCLLMLIAANIENYTLVLGGLFVLAGGITALQVAANPLAAALGAPEGSHFRLTFSQAFNSFGTFIGPIIGASLFLEGIEVKPGMEVTEAARAEALAGIDAAYFWLSGMIAMLLVFFFLSRNIVGEAAPVTSNEVARRGVLAMFKEATQSKWALLGGMAIFLYVGAEVAIGTQMAFFLNADSIWGQSDAAFNFPLINWLFTSDGTPGISLQEAAAITAIYWGGAMVGRLIGSALLAKVNAALLLAVFTGAAALMCLYVFSVGGVSAGFVALAIGLFNSIMFPVIFSLTLERSTASSEATSGFLCTAIIGGAFVPLLVGMVSGHSSYITAFIVPAACYLVLCWFALSARKVQATNDVSAVAANH